MTTALATNTTTSVYANIGFDASILAGQVGQSSIDMYARDLDEYTNPSEPDKPGWCDRAGFNPLAPATFARYRAYLASDTTLSKKTGKPFSPNTVSMRRYSSLTATLPTWTSLRL